MNRPARIMFVVLPERGHIHPLLGVAQQLESAGHEVCFFSGLDVKPWLEAASVKARCFALSPRSVNDPLPGRDRGRALVELLADRRRARRWYGAGYALVPAYVDALRTAVRDARSEVLCIDPFVYPGAIVADQERLPWAAISPLLIALTPADFRCPYLEVMDELTAERDQLFRSNGMTPPPCKFGEVTSPWLNTVFTTEEFVPRSDADNQASLYVGPSRVSKPRGDEPAFPWQWLRTDVPLLYASFGTQLSPPMQVLDAIASAFEPAEAQVVLAVGDLVDSPELPRFADNVIAVRYAPQGALLDRAAVMISHGGVNGVAEALCRGVPPLVIPIGHEQPLQAHFVERSGVGSALAPTDVTPGEVRARVGAALAPATRSRVEEVRRSYADADGAARAAALLTELARTRRPATVT